MNDWEVNLKRTLTEYTDEVNEAIKEEISKIADESVAQLKNTLLPAGVGTDSGRYTRRQWTNYARGWVAKKEEGPTYIHCKVYNKKHYRLTSLLEYGHATRNGGRTRAFPHIKPVEEEAIKKMESKIREVIEKGGKS